jgi:hypothetical protein
MRYDAFVLDLLLGPILSGLFVSGGSVDWQLRKRVVDVVATGLTSSASVPLRKATDVSSGAR